VTDNSVGSVDDMIDLAMGEDILKRVMHNMKEFDPSFALPEGFFPSNPRAREDEVEVQATNVAKQVEDSMKTN